MQSWVSIERAVTACLPWFRSPTSRHAGNASSPPATDAAVLRVILKVRDGAGGDYWWVECSACDTAWQVRYYAESVG